jgi:hypothetical protein
VSAAPSCDATRASPALNQQAEALDLLARIAGISAERPTGQSVTDTIWSWPASRRIERFYEFAETWGGRYPAIVKLWENAWTRRTSEA